MINLSKRLLLATIMSASTLATPTQATSFRETLYLGVEISNTRLEINEPGIRAAGALSPESSLQNNQNGLSIFCRCKA